MKILLSILFAVFTVSAVRGQSPSDSAKVYFRVNHHQFDPSLGDNRAAMDGFVDKVCKAVETNNIERLVVRAYASPEGSQAANVQLTRYRCETIANYLIEHTGISWDLVQTLPEGIAWAELRHLVAETPSVPSQQKVLDILDNTPLWIYDAHGKVVDGRKKQLMDLAGGAPYRWMLTHLFPELRNAVAVSVYLKSAQSVDEQAVTTASEVRSDSLDQSNPSDLCEQRDSSVCPTEVPPPSFIADDSVFPYRHLFAVKTNFLYYAALMPNLELEWLINDRWSVALEGDVAWWKHAPSHKYYQLAVISPEVRRWIHPRKPWHGMYLGLFAGGGWYDLENGGLGHYGEGWMTGLSFGYMWPIGRALSLDAGIGAGYMHTRSKEYEPYDGHYLYQRTKSIDYIGPLKLKLSLAWRFFRIHEHKKTSPTP